MMPVTFSERISRLTMTYRVPILVGILLLTLIFGYFASTVEVKSLLIDLFPHDHPYVTTYKAYEDIFGGANLILLMVTARAGTIFEPSQLGKIQKITRELELLPAVNNYQVLSIAQSKVKKVRVDSIAGVMAESVMWPKIPQSPDEIAALRKKVFTTFGIGGTLVSRDQTSALIVAGFFEKKLDPRAILIGRLQKIEALRAETFAGLTKLDAIVRRAATILGNSPAALDSLRAILALPSDLPAGSLGQLAASSKEYYANYTFNRLQEIIGHYEDKTTSLHLIGRPAIMGWVLHQYPQLRQIFMITIISIVAILFWYFRDIRGVIIPCLTAVLSAIWGVGLLGMLHYNFDPLIIVIPFVISARALSHSIQLIERYLEEIEARNDVLAAAIAAMSGLLKPSFLSLLVDAAGVFMVIITPMPIMKKMAVMGGFWLMSITVTNIIFNPLLLSYLPKPKTDLLHRVGILEKFLQRLGNWCFSWQKWLIMAVTLLLFVVGFAYAKTIVIGDVYPGTQIFWQDSEYNRDVARIAEKFGNTEILNIIVEGNYRETMSAPEVLRAMEALQMELESMPEVAGTASIADMVPQVIRMFHSDDPRWELIPADPQESAFFLDLLLSKAEPGDLDRFITRDRKDASISVYLRDHKGETLRAVISRAKAFMANHRIGIAPEYLMMKLKSLPQLTDYRYQEATKAESILAESYRVLGANDAALADLKRVLNIPPSTPATLSAYTAYIGDYWAKFRLAGGLGGLLAAVNEVITSSEAKVTIIAFVMVFFFCALSYRSFLAGFLFIVPIGVSNFLTYSLMGFFGIGLDVNSLPVVALGVGLGVDYGLYIVSRIEEELLITADLYQATLRAIMTAGRAVILTAMTMVLGVIFWAFSFMRFQAEMGMLIAFWMLISMLGGIILLPTLIAIIKPSFIYPAKKIVQ
jgi:predicted RND superfamily exporter protein